MNEEIKIEQKESIKLSKMSKGYNWEIKLLAGESGIIDTQLERLEKIDKEMQEKWGTKLE